LHSNDQIDLFQIVECEMNKQDHIESFIIEVFIALEGVRKISVGFLKNVNSTCGSWDDYWQLISLDYGSFGLPSSTKKTHDQVSNYFIIVDIIFDAPLNFLKDSNASFKMKTTEKKGVGVSSLACSILG